ncbi:MAG: hypothetical protein JO116_05615 [Planctomycetaceae bacterium]|nr:hypothetical protein [Planctomycetaceae bacterium]
MDDRQANADLLRLALLTVQPRSWDGQRHLEELALWTSDGRRDDPYQALEKLGLVSGQLMAETRPASRFAGRVAAPCRSGESPRRKVRSGGLVGPASAGG